MLDVLQLQQCRCGNLSLLLLMPRSVTKTTTGMQNPGVKKKLILILIKLWKNIVQMKQFFNETKNDGNKN